MLDPAPSGAKIAGASAPSCASSLEAQIAVLGDAPLDEARVARHLAPLFVDTLRARRGIYLANHSLAPPLDATRGDVEHALVLWSERLGGAWSEWQDEIGAYRARLARLLRAPRADSVIPKTSAGQGLRAVLNGYAAPPRVLTTRGEFDSIDTVLRQYTALGRAVVSWIEADRDGLFRTDALRAAVRQGSVDLVVVSQVMFASGQRLHDLELLIRDAHAAGAKVLLDVYHSLGALPLDIAALDADFAIGGSYKYLRGGPGACFLYVHPRHLDGGFTTLDVGWFAKKASYAYEPADAPGLAAGGDAFLESTPAILAFYQARAGQIYTLGVGVPRLRAYSLERQRLLVDALAAEGIPADGAREDRGAFTIVRRGDATKCVAALARAGVVADARGPYLRFCPDVLDTAQTLSTAAHLIGTTLRGLA